jgi:hypothetical protein
MASREIQHYTWPGRAQQDANSEKCGHTAGLPVPVFLMAAVRRIR